jgi:hypothetical protein
MTLPYQFPSSPYQSFFDHHSIFQSCGEDPLYLDYYKTVILETKHQRNIPHSSSLCPRPFLFSLSVYSCNSFIYRTTLSNRDQLLESWQYVAHPDFGAYAHWESINSTSNELRTTEDKPATIVVVGQVLTDKVAVEPLGNFQTRQQRSYQDSDSNMKCAKAKLVLVLKRPAAPGWRADFDTATGRFQALEKAVAKNNAQRLWFLDEDQTPPTIRVSFPLWEQKVDSSPTPNQPTHPLLRNIRNQATAPPS